MRIRAHYDGKVFVPDEPVRLAANSALDIWVDEAAPNPAQTERAIREYYLNASSDANDDQWGGVASADAWD